MHILPPSFLPESFASSSILHIYIYHILSLSLSIHPSLFNCMAMSDTMSGPNDWLHFYDQHNTFPSPAATTQLLPYSLSDATTVTTTTTTTTANAALGNNNNNGTSAQLSPEGRVSKPIRRRSRASRRTPTTLLNTDTTNFRAMVQQFTGAPFAPPPSSASGFPALGFGLGSRPAHVNPNGLMLAPSAFHQHHLQQQQHYMYSSGNTEVGHQRAAGSIGDEDGPGVVQFMEHGGRFFAPNTSSS